MQTMHAVIWSLCFFSAVLVALVIMLTSTRTYSPREVAVSVMMTLAGVGIFWFDDTRGNTIVACILIGMGVIGLVFGSLARLRARHARMYGH